MSEQREAFAEMRTVAEVDLSILNDVATERVLQRVEFSVTDDDALTPAEWVARIAKHLGRAVSIDRRAYRHALVVVAALAIAAIEAYDRKYGAEVE